MSSKQETKYQNGLIERIREMFPGCYVLKNDPRELQGIPDLLVLYRDRWAMLEVKTHATADVRPNQDWYVTNFDEMAFAAFVYPENEKEVLHALQRAFGA